MTIDLLLVLNILESDLLLLIMTIKLHSMITFISITKLLLKLLNILMANYYALLIQVMVAIGY